MGFFSILFIIFGFGKDFYNYLLQPAFCRAGSKRGLQNFKPALEPIKRFCDHLSVRWFNFCEEEVKIFEKNTAQEHAFKTLL